MKQSRLVLLTSAFMFFASLTVMAGTSSSGFTLSFDRTLMRLEDETRTIDYADFDFVVVGRGINLAARSYLIPLLPGEEISSVRIQSDTESVAASLPAELLYDEMTSDEHSAYGAMTSAPAQSRLGFAPGFVAGELQVAGRRYAEVMLFPVSLMAGGAAVFNKSISITVGYRYVHSSEMACRHSVLERTDWSNKSSFLKATSDSQFDYVIVTDSTLAPSFAPLVRLKNEMGIMARIKLISDVYAEYSGCDNAEKLREYLKDFYARGGRYLLLGGDETILPTRYAYNFNTDTAVSIENEQICDLYFGDLTGDWDADGDNVWGEPFDDHADLTPELMVGRLPFGQPWEVDNYVAKLIAYEMSPGNGDPSYLSKAFFFSSDQMRDYGPGGQHHQIAQEYPSQFLIDTANGVEQTRGDDPNPVNAPAEELVGIVSEGYGIVNIIAHGSNSLFSVRTSGYNNWPKSGLRTSFDTTRSDLVSKLSPNGRTSLYYSLACSNGAFDYNLPPFNEDSPNLAQTLLSLKDAGAVAFVANSRWGWVSTSYLLQRSFFDTLFAHPGAPAITAMYGSKAAYYYFRDLVYGQLFLGDPSIRIYSCTPDKLALSVAERGDTLTATASSASGPAEDCQIVLSTDGQFVGEYTTDASGRANIIYPFGLGVSYTLTASNVNTTVAQMSFTPSLVTDVDDDPSTLPTTFALFQNYPNPFNPTTTISFDLPKYAPVHLAVYNVLGQTVKVLADRPMVTGHHVVEWDGRDVSGKNVASGIYFYKLVSERYRDVKKMILVR